MDAVFVEKIKQLLKVAVPGWSSKEVKYLIILTLLLVLRTQMSIWLADVNGKIVKSIVERNFNLFLYRVSGYSSPSSGLQPYALLHSLLGSQLGHGVLHQITLCGF